MKSLVPTTILLVAFVATAQAARSRYTLSMFERGVKDTSSPRYVLFLLREPGSNSTQTVCTLGHSLVDAVQIEHGWSYAIAGWPKARGLTLRHWNEPFAFEKVNAVVRAQPKYSAQQLRAVRAGLSRFTDRELRLQLRRGRRATEPTELQQMSVGRGTPLAYGARDAIAHVLLERGILVASDARTGQLRLP